MYYEILVARFLLAEEHDLFFDRELNGVVVIQTHFFAGLQAQLPDQMIVLVSAHFVTLQCG